MTSEKFTQLQLMALALDDAAVPLVDVLLRGNVVHPNVRTILRTGLNLRQRPEPPTRVGEALFTIQMLDARFPLPNAEAQALRESSWKTICECDALEVATQARTFVADAHRLIISGQTRH